MKTGIELIAEERAAQVTREGWTPEHDDEHDAGQLADAAACYAFDAAEQVRGRELHASRVPTIYWPWDAEWWKPKDPLCNLVRAGALIAAEIDRLQRNEAYLDTIAANKRATETHSTLHAERKP